MHYLLCSNFQYCPFSLASMQYKGMFLGRTESDTYSTVVSCQTGRVLVKFSLFGTMLDELGSAWPWLIIKRRTSSPYPMLCHYVEGTVIHSVPLRTLSTVLWSYKMQFVTD